MHVALPVVVFFAVRVTDQLARSLSRWKLCDSGNGRIDTRDTYT